MSHLIDVIIPMYNRADCVLNIIRQLENQTFKDFRAIFVNDGSTDNTAEVLEQELQKAKFDFTVITKLNGGAGSARNAGIRASDSQWISFVDSDDELRPQFLEYLYSAATSSGSDLAICDMMTRFKDESAETEPLGDLRYNTITPAEAMKHFCTKWFGPWGIFMNREMAFENELFFDENCIYNEDAPYISEVIAACSKVAKVDMKLYVYILSNGSLHRSPRLDKFLSAVESFKKTEKKLLSTENDAAKVFNGMGGARFYIATLRRAAVQLSIKDFKTLENEIKFKEYKHQFKNLQLSQKIACYLFLFSKTLFYYAMKSVFND